MNKGVLYNPYINRNTSTRLNKSLVYEDDGNKTSGFTSGRRRKLASGGNFANRSFGNRSFANRSLDKSAIFRGSVSRSKRNSSKETSSKNTFFASLSGMFSKRSQSELDSNRDTKENSKMGSIVKKSPNNSNTQNFNF